ncbi:MAG: xanthine dehydrogenase family protein subunit M [Betaproteobacteria bacterium]|jgi:carbon-monoxide dehydrogenase medium subunit
MKPVSFTYHKPQQLSEALDLVAQLDNYKIIAGGQSLMPMMNFRFVMPDHVIDLNQVSELSHISKESQHLHIGAMTRQQAIYSSALVQEHIPLITQAYSFVSHRQIRNRGTFGGSLCHLDPSSEQPCFTAALDGVIEVASQSGKREIPIANWTAMYMTPDLAPNEIMLGAKLSIWPKTHGWSFMEYSRRHGDYAIVGVAVLVSLNAASTIEKISIALCGIDAAPVRLLDTENALINQAADENAIRMALDDIEKLPNIMEDALNTSDYRRHLAKTLTRRAMLEAFERAKKRMS